MNEPDQKGGSMSDTTASLRRKIGSAGDLQSVVRTMKALAASSIGQYEKSVRALGDYYRTVELGLGACFRAGESAANHDGTKRTSRCGGDRRGRLRFRPGTGRPVQRRGGRFCREDPRRLPGQPKSGPSASAFMRA
jgi:hypothetical protein